MPWGGDWMDCCLRLVAPVGLSPLAFVLCWNPFPLQAALPILGQASSFKAGSETC